MATSTHAERKPILTPEEAREFEGYEFPFENLALQGGGSKGTAYVGTIRVLEEVGIFKNLKRFAGASIGAMIASFVALGCDSYEIEEMVAFDASTLFMDARFGLIGQGINLFRMMGANPAHKLKLYFQDLIRRKFGNPDLTFQQLYEQTGRELCLTTVSLNRLEPEYLHVKTTPDMPIWLAIRASESVPGVMMPIKYKVMSKQEDVLVDGGILHNYPIDCFDSWYLSLNKKDSFLRRFHEMFTKEDKFDGYNEKSLGAVLISEQEVESYKVHFDERAEKYKKPGDSIPLPDTERARKRNKSDMNKVKLQDASKQALKKFIQVLSSYDKDDSGSISKQEFKTSLESASETFTSDDAKLLFGTECNNPDAIFNVLDTNGNGEIEFCELLAFAEKKGVDMMENLRGFERLTDFDSLTGLFGALLNALVINANRLSFKNADVGRTIAINTGYLGSTDFDMESADRAYIAQCGKMGTVYFLREYIEKHKLQRKTRDVTGAN